MATNSPASRHNELVFSYLRDEIPWDSFISNITMEKLSQQNLSALQFACCKVWCKKQKFINFQPKMQDLRISGLEFEHIIVMFEISILELSNCKIS